MKRLSKSKSISAMLGAGLLMLAACAPDSLTRGGAAQPIPVERGNENGATSNANEALAPAAPGLNSETQPAEASSSRSTLTSPLSTPMAPSTPKPQDEIEFTDTVEVIAGDLWVVGGRTVAVTAVTEIKPGLTIGTPAKVHAVPQADGSLWAREIEPAGVNDNANGNSNSNDDNGNGNVNSNDDQGNDNGNGNMNSNEDMGNDNNGNVNSNDANGNDDQGNANSNDNSGNDDQGGNANNHNSNDDHGGNSNDNK